MSEKTKKWLAAVGLFVVSIGLVFGISQTIYREPPKEVSVQAANAEETDIVVEMDVPDLSDEAKKDEKAVKEAKNGAAKEDAAEEKEMEEEETVNEAEPESLVHNGTQKLQENPVKNQVQKPVEPPALEAGAQINNPQEPPEYEKQPDESQEDTGDTITAHGQTKDGMIYIDGFGWIPDNGGGGSGTVAGDMYENGNKIGIMD